MGAQKKEVKCQKFSTSFELVAESQSSSGKRKISEHAQKPSRWTGHVSCASAPDIPPVYEGRFLTEAEEHKQEGDGEIDVLEGQECPICKAKTCTLTEQEKDIPYFGKVFLFSMNCESCKYHKSDVECAEQKDPCKYMLDIESEEDLKIRVVRSSEATIKVPHVMTIEPGPSSNGYVTNVEGILNRMKNAVETAKENEEDDDVRKKAKNMLKKLNKVLWGQEKVKLIIEDPSGNSTIISKKVVYSKMKS